MKMLWLFIASLSVLPASIFAAEPAAESLLWKVTGNGLEKPSYLLGTHHLGNISILENYPSYRDAIRSADLVVGELDMESLSGAQEALMQYGTMPDGVTYRDLLSEENYDKLENYLMENFGTGMSRLGGFKPAMISTMYVQMSYIASDPSFDPASHEPIDGYIQRLGREGGKKVIGLETVDEQMELLMNFEPLEVQAQSLLCAMENEDTGLEFMRLLNEFYAEGRLQAMYDLSFDNPDDPCPSSEEFQLALVNRRNANWLGELPGMMAESSVLVAVGALHLAGEPGLVNRMREMGYTVEPIK